MPDFIFLMHDDGADAAGGDWGPYLTSLQQRGCFQGGSGIGDGACFHKGSAQPLPASDNIVGYIRVAADDLAAARALLTGNPVYEAGGVIEIRELPKG